MSRLKAVLFIFLFSALFSGVRADESAESIIKKARDYVAGDSALKAIETIIYKGDVFDSTGKKIDTIQLSLKKPNKQHIIYDNDTRIETTAVNGFEGYKVHASKEDGKVELFVLMHDFVRRMIVNASEGLFFFNAHKHVRGAEVVYEGEETVKGKKCHVLKYTYARVGDYKRFVDVKTGALVATIDANGLKNVENGEIVVKGIRFPAEFVAYDSEDNKLLKIVFTDIQVNKLIKEDVFDFPKNMADPTQWEKVE